jgi:hypothetical protein
MGLPKRYLVVDIIGARLSRFVLPVSTGAMKLMLSANVDSCPKMHEVVDAGAVVCQRPKFLNQLRFDEWFDVVDRPRDAPEGDVILRDQSRWHIVKQEPHCGLVVSKVQTSSLRLRPTVKLDGDCNGAIIKVSEAAERDDGRVDRQFPV